MGRKFYWNFGRVAELYGIDHFFSFLAARGAAGAARGAARAARGSFHKLP